MAQVITERQTPGLQSGRSAMDTWWHSEEVGMTKWITTAPCKVSEMVEEIQIQDLWTKASKKF